MNNRWRMPKMKYVAPIGKNSFRIHVFESSMIQLGFVFIVSILLHVGNFQLLEVSTFFYIAFIVLLNFFLLWFVFDIDKYRARFKDVFPDKNLSIALFFLYGFIPFAFVVFTIFLCSKESEELRPIPKIFKIRYSLVAVIPLVILQISSPIVSYWVASPSTYFIVDTYHDANEIIKYKETAAFTERSNLIEEYQEKYSNKLSSTELILLIAVNSSLAFKEKNRAIASGEGKVEAGIKYGLHVLNACHKLLLISEATRLNFLDYSPVHWFYPSGPIEILLLSVVEQQILLKFNKVLLDTNLSSLDKLDKKNLETSSPRKEYYAKEIFELRKKFSQTRTFASET